MDEDAGVPIREVNTGLDNSNPYAGMSQKECTDRIRKALSRIRTAVILLFLLFEFSIVYLWRCSCSVDPTVKFLRQHMEKAGCPVWVRLLMAVNCKEHNFAGGYSSQNGVFPFPFDSWISQTF